MTGFSLRRHDRLPSTNDEVRRLARQGTSHGTVVIAGEQTRGRGRHGRAWASAPGNLYLSLLLRPALTARRAAEVGFLAALAVADAVDGSLPDGIRAGLKWPNDVRVRGAKVAGILLETELCADSIAWMAVGVGVNVGHHPADTPYSATSLHSQGASEATPDQIAAALLEAFGFWWETWLRDGFRPVREAWLARADQLGQIIHVRERKGTVTGRFEGIDTDGALLLALGAGQRRITAGDVSFCPE